jgi:hypothetical protein
MKVYKYPLVMADDQHIELPRGAGILCVKIQNGTICLWALVNPEARKEKRTIAIRGTGHPIDDDFEHNYLGTVMTHEMQLVFHVFEILN